MEYLFGLSLVVNGLYALSRLTPTTKDDKLFGKAKRVLDRVMLGHVPTKGRK